MAFVKEGTQFDRKTGKWTELFECEAESDIADIPECCPGSTAKVLQTGALYTMSNMNTWVPQGCAAFVQPDWNQNDPAAADYVKNRPPFIPAVYNVISLDYNAKTWSAVDETGASLSFQSLDERVRRKTQTYGDGGRLGLQSTDTGCLYMLSEANIYGNDKGNGLSEIFISYGRVVIKSDGTFTLQWFSSNAIDGIVEEL